MRLLIGVPIAAVMLVWGFHEQAEETRAKKAKMIEMCQGDAACIRAVHQHAEACFNAWYKIPRRRRSIDSMGQFLACVNERSRATFFATVPEE